MNFRGSIQDLKRFFEKARFAPPPQRGAKRAFSKKQATTIYWKIQLFLLEKRKKIVFRSTRVHF